jgi:putative transposase
MFQVSENAEIVVDVLLRHRKLGAYLLHEFVLMPDHLHLLLTPGSTTTLEKAMQLIKGGSSFEIHSRRGHKMGIWQAGFHEWTIRDARDFENKAGYIRANPVRAKLVERAEDWPYGSAQTRFQCDLMPPNLLQGLKPL